MFQKLIVPVDGSAASFAAVPVGARMAAAVAGTFEVITVVDRLADVALARDTLDRDLADLSSVATSIEHHVLAGDSVAETIARRVEQTPGAMVAMSSHGHGRSAAVFGSTCDAVLRELFGPVIVIGPNADETAGRLDGAYVVPLDGSKLADGVLPIVAAWTTEFDGTPWVIEVGKEWPTYVGDVVDSSFVSSRAFDLRRKIDREVQFEVLHGGHTGRSITDFAREMNASLVFMTTHGRTGLARLRAGSVAAEVIRHAHCPVVVFRPPQLHDGSELAASGSRTRSHLIGTMGPTGS
jgi:nucleotide-binding universal stress UspA family protein